MLPSLLSKVYVRATIWVSLAYVEWGIAYVAYANAVRAYQHKIALDRGVDLFLERLPGRMIYFGLAAVVFAVVGILLALAVIWLLRDRNEKPSGSEAPRVE